MGPSTSETTSSVKWPVEVEEAQKKVVGGAVKGMEPYLNDPSVNIAPLRDEYGLLSEAAKQALAGQSNNAGMLDPILQRAAGANYGDQLGGLTGYAKRTDFGDDASQLQSQNQQVNFAPQMAGMVGAGERTIPIASSFAQTDANEALELGNPWAEHMADKVIGGIDDAHEKSANAIAGRAARRSGFGGSGEAIAMSQLDNNRSNQTEDALKGIMYDSYGVGSNLASQNMNSRNQALGRTVGAMFGSNAQDMNALSGAESLMGGYNNRNQSNIGLMDSLANNYVGRNTQVAGAQDGLESNYQNRNLQGIGAKDQFDNSALSRTAQSMGLLGSMADKYQSYDQMVADKDWTAMARMGGFIPGMTGTQVNSEPANNSGFLGAALTGLGMFL
jgi:hypothetical protein